MNDTIFAPATAAGRGAVAVFRVSGPRAGQIVGKITDAPLPTPRRASVRRLHGGDGDTLDQALVLWMPGPASFTGEDCAELHLHGGAAIIGAVGARLEELGLRLAQPGEFTRRAFEHGRLDLSQAEAVADLVDAETSFQRRQAMAQYGGALSARYEAWRDALLDVLALLEAAIDFPDEDVPVIVSSQATDQISNIAAEMAEAIGDTQGERIREGLRVALVGAPNVGKSSLLNAITGRDAAIVTDQAGTTRDVIEVAFVLDGQLVILADTAGLREAGDIVEVEGVRRAKAWARSAELRIGVVDRTRPETLPQALEELRAGDILALNKSDVDRRRVVVEDGVQAVETIATSAGIALLRVALGAKMAARTHVGFPAVTRARHRSLLLESHAHLARAMQAYDLSPELAGEDVRLAMRSLEQVTGRSNPDAVLDRVFSSFCVGK